MNTDLHRFGISFIRVYRCVAVATILVQRLLIVCFFLALVLLFDSSEVSAEGRVALPSGFRLTQVATDELATNIFCMIALPDGTALVSGPGYIKQLMDEDDDGELDRAKRVSDFPKSGAQGMAVDGEDLLCVGDGGIWRLPGVLSAIERDEDLPSQSPVLLFKISTWGEHHAHSIQKGPDGWWYHIAGNDSVLDTSQCDGPIRERRAGVIMRFSPDFSQRQIVAHGFRNAYDFAFNSTDQLFTFDSDGERDLGLPWYRPTRVFEIVPGDDAGWVSRTWKRPSYYFDMPRLVGDAGRASPTGVVCYNGQKFPVEYDDAIFLGDWTFGRVLVCRRDWKTGKYLPPEDFLLSKESFGFPVTDLAVANDGSLLISVGGRGTEGGVYRIDSTTTRTKSDATVGLPVWEHRTAYRQDLKIKVLIERASKTFVQKGPSLQVDSLATLLAYSESMDVEKYGPQILPLLLKASRSNHPKVIAATFRLAGALCDQDGRWETRLAWEKKPKVTDARLFTLTKLASQPTEAERRTLFDFLVNNMLRGGDVENKTLFPVDVACRLAQLTFGGVGLSEGFFSSVTANDLFEQTLGEPKVFRDRIGMRLDSQLSRETVLELWRLAAMQNISSSQSDLLMFDRMMDAGRPSADSNPRSNGERRISFGDLRLDASPDVSEELFWQMCFVKIGRSVDDKAVQGFSDSLNTLPKEYRTKNVSVDSHFRPLLDELAERAFKRYPQLAKRFLNFDEFGASHHGYLFSEFSDDDLPSLQEKVLAWIADHPGDATSDHVHVLATKPTLESIGALRNLAKNSSLKDAVTLELAKCGGANDEVLFIEGLQSLDPKVQKESAIALRKRVPEVSAETAAVAVQAALRLGNEQQDVSIRDQLILLLQTFSNQDFGYQLKRPDLRQGDSLKKWRSFLIERRPELVLKLKPAQTIQQQMARLEKLDWDSGDPTRGASVYGNLQCATCHGASRALGPRLEGVTKRMSKTDLLTAIVNPDAQVSDRYRTTLFETVDGLLHSGSVIYQNVDGVTIREASGRTVRLNRDQIESQRRSAKSLMPTGLLDRATDQEIVDLMAWLGTL